MTKEYDPMLDHPIRTAFTIAPWIALFSLLITGARTYEPKYPKEIGYEQVIVQDVNRDGLEDVISDDKTVKLKQKDGGYITLGKARANAIDSVERSYSFRPERVRNSVDNLDYEVKTGKYIVGN